MIAIQHAFACLSAIWFMSICCASAARPSTHGARVDISTAVQIQQQEPRFPGLPLPQGAEHSDYPRALQTFFGHGGKLSTGEVKKLLLAASEQLLLELKLAPGIVNLNLDNEQHSIHVIGDLHGHLPDLLTIFEIAGSPSPTNPFLFNGDFVDRGSWSVEVILVLLAWKVALPEHVHLNRGNHEYSSISSRYGFRGEIMKKYEEDAELVFQEFHQVFAYLPIVHVISKSVFVTHGGLSIGGEDLSRIEKSLTRTRRPDMSFGLEHHLVWNDPMPENGISKDSPRGPGCFLFGPDKTRDFLERNELTLVIRSHQPRSTGISMDHNFTKDGNGELTGLMTVFSAADYVNSNNTGAIATVRLIGRSVEVRACHYWNRVHLGCDIMVEPHEKEDHGKRTGLLHRIGKAWKSASKKPIMVPPHPLPPIV